MYIDKKYENKIRECFKSQQVVIFIGAGVSQNLGLPSWSEFAYKHVDILYNNKIIDYKTKELLYKDNYRTVMSLCKNVISKNEDLQKKTLEIYKKLFEVKIINEEREIINIKNLNGLSDDEINKVKEYIRKKQIKEKINDPDGIFKKLYDINAIYITTNYDDVFDILAEEANEDEIKNVFSESKGKNEEKKVFYLEEDFNYNSKNKQIRNGQVYHIHGSINKIEDMIVSNEDYIVRYWKGKNSFKDFLKYIFDNYNIIFIGYGLEELEILNYMFEGDKSIIDKCNKKRILITNSYENEEKGKINLLKDYYKDNYNIDICCYDMTEQGYRELKCVVAQMYEIKNEIESKERRLEETIKLMELI